jgi:Leucine-rich repeat (LRR) protein
VPHSVFSLTELSTLSLTESTVQLTPQSISALAEMKSLVYLDLSENPLGLAPDVSRLSELESLYLPDAALREMPRGVFGLPELHTLDVSDNLIEELPTDLLEMAAPLDEVSDFSGNPWSAQSLNALRQYYLQSGNDLAVDEARVDSTGTALVRSDSTEPMEE